MGISKKLATGCLATTLSAFALVPAVQAAEPEVSASVGIASSYLWRGFDLGSGTPAIFGDIGVSMNGFHAGVWGSSGDTAAGTEYDLIVGYGGESGDFSYDISIVSYVYPTGQFKDTDGPGDFMEAILSIGYGPVSIVYHDNIAGDTGGYAFDEDYSYAAVSAAFGKFSATIGHHMEDAPVSSSVTGDATHLDLTYSYNDYLAFTVSGIVDSDSGYDEADPTFVVSFTLPIDFKGL